MTGGRLNVTVVSVAHDVWGSEVSILALAPYLAERGVDLSVAAPVGAFARQARDNGIRHILLDLPAHAGLVDQEPSLWRSAARALREIPRVIDGVKRVQRATADADVVHCNSLLATMDCAIAGRISKRPTIIEIHDIVRPGLSRNALSTAIKIAYAGVAISTPVAESVTRWASARVHRVPQAVDTTRYFPATGTQELGRTLTSQPDEPVIAIVGRIDRAKGIHRVVDAVAALHDAGVACSLVVVGRASDAVGDYEAQTRADALRSLGDRVRFTGHRNDIPEILRAVDIVVNASDQEPFGLSILEAQACGVPVACADAGGVRDFVLDGQTGRLFSLDDDRALAVVLRELIGSPASRHRLALAALRQTAEMYSMPIRADILADLYRSMARAGSSSLHSAVKTGSGCR